MAKWMKRGSVLGLMALLAAACADEAPPRSFVQPNAIKVKDLEGTYHYLQTVTEAPPTNGAMFIGQSSSLMTIRFDVQENYLYARRAYEQIQGTEDVAQQNQADYKGMPLAVWRIESHFDIIRDFNSTTGEQTNKIIESQERPWQQREFIRVDWSQNLVTDYVGLGMDLFFGDGSPQVQQVSYWESDPSKPNALHLEHAAADQGGIKQGELTYLDVTDQMIVTPENLTLSFVEGGVMQSFSIPKCFLPYELADCASQKVSVKHAFTKIDPVHQVEPRDWDGNQMNLFGVWDVGLRRLTYNRDYGITNSGVSRHAARFNIWEKSCRQGNVCEAMPLNDGTGRVNFMADGNVVYTWDPTKDSTQAMKPGDDPHDTRLPWSQRKLVQIPYYAEGSFPITFQGDKQFPDGMQDHVFPPTLFPQFADIVHQWNEAMKGAVKDMRPDLTTIPDIFVPCHNPVRDEDPKICAQGLVADIDSNGKIVNDKNGHPILHARQGDPRRSTIFWVNEEQLAGPLGYGPPLYDELTGETISGQAYIYGAALDTYVARSRDLMLLQNGEIDPGDFTDGKNVIDAVLKNRAGSPAGRTIKPAELAAMAKAMDFNWAKGFTKEHGYPELDFTSVKALKESMSLREKAINDGFFSHAVDTRDERLSKLAGTPLEKMMYDPSLAAVNGVSPMQDFSQMSELQKIQASPIRAKMIAKFQNVYRQLAEMRGADFENFDDEGLASELSTFLKKYGNKLAPHAEEIRSDLRQAIFLAVTLHEVGHNMGCRHNFRGSWDSMNYFPDYWKLRTEALQHPDEGMAPSDGNLHPRYMNQAGGAVTQYESQNGIRNLQYSSIMDYGAEFNSDLQGLGMYDHAFIKFSYGHYVEVFTDAKTDATSQNKISSLQQFQSALGFPSALGTGEGLSAVSYQSYPTLFQSGYQGIYKRADVPYWEIKDKAFDRNGDTVQADKSGNPMVPYYFCSDEFVGNLTCQRFDAGADAYEQAADIISRYKNFYLYNNFKRDRATFYSSAGYLSRIHDRYFEMLRDQLTWYVLLRSDFESYLTNLSTFGVGDPSSVPQRASQFFVDPEGWGNFTAAVSAGFELMGEVLTTPGAGWHMKGTDSSGNFMWTHYSDTLTDISAQEPSIRTVPLGAGKYIDTTWNQNCGYYWADECQQRIGYFVDKTLALDVLSESQAYFIGRDTSVDVRQYAIGYILPFKKQIEEKFGALLSSDTRAYAPYFSGSSSSAQVVNPSWIMADPKPTATDFIDPQTGFTINLYVGAYALAAFPTTFDHEFLDNSKIFVVGNGEAWATDAEIQANGTYNPSLLVSHGGTKEWFLYRDPSGKLLAAHATPTAPAEVIDVNSTDASSDYQTKTVDLRNDVGVRMLERLKQLDNNWSADQGLDSSDPTKDAKVSFDQLQYNNYRQNIEVMRSLHNAFGYGPFMTDAPFYY